MVKGSIYFIEIYYYFYWWMLRQRQYRPFNCMDTFTPCIFFEFGHHTVFEGSHNLGTIFHKHSKPYMFKVTFDKYAWFLRFSYIILHKCIRHKRNTHIDTVTPNTTCRTLAQNTVKSHEKHCHPTWVKYVEWRCRPVQHRQGDLDSL
jgi:hypothetical protein